MITDKGGDTVANKFGGDGEVTCYFPMSVVDLGDPYVLSSSYFPISKVFPTRHLESSIYPNSMLASLIIPTSKSVFLAGSGRCKCVPRGRL